MKFYDILFFFNKHVFLVPDRSLKGHVLCSTQSQGAREITATLQCEHQGDRNDHSSPQLTQCSCFSVLDLILSQLCSKDSWFYLTAAVAVTLQVQFRKAESSVN